MWWLKGDVMLEVVLAGEEMWLMGKVCDGSLVKYVMAHW